MSLGASVRPADKLLRPGPPSVRASLESACVRSPPGRYELGMGASHTDLGNLTHSEYNPTKPRTAQHREGSRRTQHYQRTIDSNHGPLLELVEELRVNGYILNDPLGRTDTELELL